MRWWFSVLTFVAALAVATGVSAQPATGDAGALATTSTGLGAASGDAAVAPAATPPAPVPFEDGGTLTGEQYVVRLRDLEQRINELKEEIFRSKARLSLLAESVLQNVVGGSRAVISHQNEMGGAYRLVSLIYSLDGAPILSVPQENDPRLERRSIQVYNGQVGSGDHTLGVNLEYLGAGLPYMKGYRFRVRSTQSFSVPEGKAILIRVVGYEKGGPLEPPENRPAIRYVQRLVSLRDAAEQSGEGAIGAAGGQSEAQSEAQGGATPAAGNNP